MAQYAVGKFEAGLDKTNQFIANYISGMTPINEIAQGWTGIAGAQSIYNAAKAWKKTGRMTNVKRLLAMGWSNDDAAKIYEQVLKHAETTDGIWGRKLSMLNVEKWDDATTSAMLTSGLSKWSRRVIQENNIGNLAGWMSKDLGRIIFQFRAFQMGAIKKQLLWGVHQRDATAASNWMGGMIGGALVYTGYTYASSIGRDDRKDFLKKRLSLAAIATGGFQRSGFSTVLPMAIDSAMIGNPIFGTRARTTGQSTNIMGFPVASMASSAIGALGTAKNVAFDPDYKFSQHDYRNIMRLMPVNRALGVKNLINIMGNDLPRRSKSTRR